MESNPYESPHVENANLKVSRHLLTRRTVFWSGMGSVVLAVTSFNGRHALFGHSKVVDGPFDSAVAAMDILAVIVLVVGCVAVIVSHWLPNAPKGKPWRRDMRS